MNGGSVTLISKYDPKDKVKITAIDMDGTIDQVCWNGTNTEYRVVYWNNGERNSTWLYEWEIGPSSREKPLPTPKPTEGVSYA
jgi:hypothetical protein